MSYTAFKYGLQVFSVFSVQGMKYVSFVKSAQGLM